MEHFGFTCTHCHFSMVLLKSADNRSATNASFVPWNVHSCSPFMTAHYRLADTPPPSILPFAVPHCFYDESMLIAVHYLKKNVELTRPKIESHDRWPDLHRHTSTLASRAAESHRLCGFVLRPRFMTPINSLFHFQIFQSILIDFLFFKTFLCIVPSCYVFSWVIGFRGQLFWRLFSRTRQNLAADACL